jgi:hypothetical protein
METGKSPEDKQEKRKEMIIMKKSEKVLFAIYKVIYVITMAAMIFVYFRAVFDKTGTYSSLSSNDFFVGGLMSVVMVLIAEKESVAKKNKTAVL